VIAFNTLQSSRRDDFAAAAFALGLSEEC